MKRNKLKVERRKLGLPELLPNPYFEDGWYFVDILMIYKDAKYLLHELDGRWRSEDKANKAGERWCRTQVAQRAAARERDIIDNKMTTEERSAKHAKRVLRSLRGKGKRAQKKHRPVL